MDRDGKPGKVALALVGLAAELAPTFARWLASKAAGDDDPVAVQVRAILPEESASARAARELADR